MEEKILGFIGFGEAAQAFIQGLKDEGYSKIKVYSHHKPGTAGFDRYQTNADSLNVKLYSDLEEFLQDTEIICSLVPCAVSLETAQEIIPMVPKDCIYLDLTASLPEEKKMMNQISEENDKDFCDGAIMGAVPNFKHKVPIFISGKQGERITQFFNQWGTEFEYVGEVAGQASALKLCRSIYTKGTQALIVELVTTAEHYQITQKILENIDQTYYLNGFKAEAERLLKSSYKHSKRRTDELKNVIKMIENLGENAGMSKAAMELFMLIDSTNT